MATPPRNDPRDRPPGAPPNKGKRWALYLGIAVVVLLILFVLLGDVFTTEPALEEDAAIEGTTPEAGATEEIDSAAGDSPVPETTDGQTDAAEPADPADEAQEDDEEVIEIEGDAEVEILDEN